MLTRLRFKNWRSLKDVEISDLTPITVFIGANSSGKTNIVDSLSFYRDSLTQGLLQTVRTHGYRTIQTNAPNNDEDVVLEFNFSNASSHTIREILSLHFEKRDVPFKYTTELFEGETLLRVLTQELPLQDVTNFDWTAVTEDDEKREQRARQIINQLYPAIALRWQILGHNFALPQKLNRRESGDLYVIEKDTRNVLFILDFMHVSYPAIYNELQEDLSWLLPHVNDLVVQSDFHDQNMEIVVRESDSRRAATISSGTARLIALLTAVYALDIPQKDRIMNQEKPILPSEPGLIVIEEPDTALNPLILRKLVELLRTYVNGEYPRQFILTTHNPAFLNFFKPEEVRVVERDEQGYTHVSKIPPYIEKIWLEDGEYGLGDVWMTHSLNGLFE